MGDGEVYQRDDCDILRRSPIAPTKTNVQRLESSIGLYYYGARWYDPAVGRFIQADSIIPDAGSSQSYDRYHYVGNNPLRYIDPTGNKYCESFDAEGNCQTEKSLSKDWETLTESNDTDLVDPSDLNPDLIAEAIKNGYDQADIDRGMDTYKALKNNKGWWDHYIDWNDPVSIWRFILSLAFTYETYSLRSSNEFPVFKDLMTKAFTNQFWDLTDSFGAAGGLIYIGTMEALNIRIGSLFNDIDSLKLRTSLDEVLRSTSITIIDQSERSNAPNAPYDFGSCPSGCPYTMGTGIDQAIWLSGDNKAYIRSREQFYK